MIQIKLNKKALYSGVLFLNDDCTWTLSGKILTLRNDYGSVEIPIHGDITPAISFHVKYLRRWLREQREAGMLSVSIDNQFLKFEHYAHRIYVARHYYTPEYVDMYNYELPAIQYSEVNAVRCYDGTLFCEYPDVVRQVDKPVPDFAIDQESCRIMARTNELSWRLKFCKNNNLEFSAKSYRFFCKNLSGGR